METVTDNTALAAAAEAETARLMSLMDGTRPVSPATAALARRLLATDDPQEWAAILADHCRHMSTRDGAR